MISPIYIAIRLPIAVIIKDIVGWNVEETYRRVPAFQSLSREAKYSPLFCWVLLDPG